MQEPVTTNLLQQIWATAMRSSQGTEEAINKAISSAYQAGLVIGIEMQKEEGRILLP